MSKDSIDYSILWKYMNASLSATEEQELSNWLNANPKHRAYFESLLKHKAKSEKDNIDVNSLNAWKEINASPKSKKKYFWKVTVAATILLLIAAYFSYETKKFKTEHVVVGINDIQIEPGTKKATLILNSGEKLNLESEKDTLIQAAEVIIKNTKNQLNYQPSKQEQNNKETEYNTLLTPRGGEYRLTLSDGTEVMLNSETILRYPVVFDDKQRSIQLVGEAYFNVKTDSLRPFIITSGKHVVKVYGTSFNLKSYKNESYVATTLVKGLVAVSSNNENATEKFLGPGFQSIYHKESNSFEQKKVNVKEYTSWINGRFYFRDMRLDEITELLGRWYNVDFEFNNENKKALTFNGNLKRYENIQTILNQLVKTNEITFTAYEKIIYIN